MDFLKILRFHIDDRDQLGDFCRDALTGLRERAREVSLAG